MKDKPRSRSFYARKLVLVRLILALSLTALITGPGKMESAGQAILPAQEAAPDLPGDATLVYYADAANKAVALPFETGLASLNIQEAARSTRIGYVELKGANAAIVIDKTTPRFYVFVADRMEPPPHQLLRLGGKKNQRRFTIVTEKGRKGFSPVAVESVELQYRIVERLQIESSKNRVLFINYMEIRPRKPLSPGEYVIIGNSLSDIATFRIE